MIDPDRDVQEGLKALARPGPLWPNDARDRILAQVRRRQRRRVAVGGALTTGGLAAIVLVGVLVAGAPVSDKTSEAPVATTTPSTAPTGSATAKADPPRTGRRPLTLAEVKRLNRHDLLLQPPTGAAEVSREAAIRVATHTGKGGPGYPVRAWLQTATTRDFGRWVNGQFQPEADHRLTWVVAVPNVRLPIWGPITGAHERPGSYRTTVVTLVDAHTGEWISASG